MTKKQKELLYNYRSAKHEYLYQVYGTCSKEKQAAFEECRKKQADHNGRAGRITSASRWLFSYAFIYTDTTGADHLYYITKSKDYDFVIE